MTVQTLAPALTAATLNSPARAALHGVHHTARPTWKLKATIRFYRDILGLRLVHAISAKGWGPETHPDFVHFFFDSGNASTIAFFYYIGTDCPANMQAEDTWLYRSVHTAWRVETREELLQWQAHLEQQKLSVLQVRHEIIESIYVTDPNGYMIEFTWQVRPMNEHDAVDAHMTIAAALQAEDEQAARGGRLQDIDTVWRGKAQLVKAYLAQGSGS
jgi:catechol 2,3-dioxygenase-like lactoylglutathione lyase family enzyme